MPSMILLAMFAAGALCAAGQGPPRQPAQPSPETFAPFTLSPSLSPGKRNEIEARDASRLEEATERAADALAQRFGSGAIDGRIRALVVTATR